MSNQANFRSFGVIGLGDKKEAIIIRYFSFRKDFGTLLLQRAIWPNLCYYRVDRQLLALRGVQQQTEIFS